MPIYNQLLNSLPKNWDDVSINDFVSLYTIDPELTQTERNIELIMILAHDATEESFDELDIDELDELLKALRWISLEPKLTYNESIDEYVCLDMRQLTLGEFIELLGLFKGGYMNNLALICSIFYRKNLINDFNNPVIEPFATYDFQERAEMFGEKPISEVYGLISTFLKFRDQVFEAYKQLFNPEGSEQFEEGYEPTEEDLRELEDEQKMNAWAWEALVFRLADGDILKMQEVTKLPLIFVFNTLSMKKALKF